MKHEWDESNFEFVGKYLDEFTVQQKDVISLFIAMNKARSN